MIMRHGSMDFSLVPNQAYHAPTFDGSMIRGALGHALKRLVCVMRRPECSGCPLENTCMYVSIFETRAGAQAPARFVRPPHPFVLRGNLRAQRGDEVARISFRIHLFGQALDHAPFVAHAVAEAARRGLGADRVPFNLAAVTTGSGHDWKPGRAYPFLVPEPTPPAVPELLRLRFVTPTRLQRDGRPVDAQTLDGPGLARAIQRRVSLMTAFHGTNTFGLNQEILTAEAENVEIVSQDVLWRKLMRHSTRQKAKQAIGGITGEVTIDLSRAPKTRDLARWLPAMHLGKGTSMGLGHVELASA